MYQLVTDHTKTLAGETVRGTIWAYSAFFVSKLFVFVSNVILARLLAPDAFGLLALALVMVSILNALADFGVGAAVIWRQDDPKRTAHVAFTISMIVGILLALTLLIAAPMLAAFFDEPMLQPILSVLSLSFVISGYANIYVSLLKKALDFRRRFVPEVTKSFTKGVVAISLAIAGFGVWSLIWGQLIGWIVAAVLYRYLSPLKLRAAFDWAIAKGLVRYGWQIIMLGILGILAKQMDYLIIGKVLDAESLGFYFLAFMVPDLVVMNICYVISLVIFPVYSRLQDKPDELRRWIADTLRYVSLITVPASLGIALIAPEFVRVFYSENWVPVISVMQVLAVYTLVYSFSFNIGDAFKAIGRPEILTRLNILKLLIQVPLLWWAARQSLVTVAWMLVAITVFMTILQFMIVQRVTAARISQLLKSLLPSLVGGAAMWAIIAPLKASIADWPPIVVLILSVIVGAVCYIAAVYFYDRKILLDLKSLPELVRSKPTAGQRTVSRSNDS